MNRRRFFAVLGGIAAALAIPVKATRTLTARFTGWGYVSVRNAAIAGKPIAMGQLVCRDSDGRYIPATDFETPTVYGIAMENADKDGFVNIAIQGRVA